MEVNEDEIINSMIEGLKEKKPTIADYKILGTYYIKSKWYKLKTKIKRTFKK